LTPVTYASTVGLAPISYLPVSPETPPPVAIGLPNASYLVSPFDSVNPSLVPLLCSSALSALSNANFEASNDAVLFASNLASLSANGSAKFNALFSKDCCCSSTKYVYGSNSKAN